MVENKDVAAADSTGETRVRGACTTIGGHTGEARAGGTIDPDGWPYTGELGARGSRELVRMTGRVKAGIARAGKNGFPLASEVRDSGIRRLRGAVVGLRDVRSSSSSPRANRSLASSGCPECRSECSSSSSTGR